MVLALLNCVTRQREQLAASKAATNQHSAVLPHVWSKRRPFG